MGNSSKFNVIVVEHFHLAVKSILRSLPNRFQHILYGVHLSGLATWSTIEPMAKGMVDIVEDRSHPILICAFASKDSTGYFISKAVQNRHVIISSEVGTFGFGAGRT